MNIWIAIGVTVLGYAVKLAGLLVPPVSSNGRWSGVWPRCCPSPCSPPSRPSRPSPTDRRWCWTRGGWVSPPPPWR
ncbi:hypothetical protein ACR6C2_33725 [Streptomyces sp. INA 01156]